HAQVVPDDPKYGGQWGLNGPWGINAPAAWDTTTGTTHVIVADIDSGIDYKHPDLVNNLWINQAEIPPSRLSNLTDPDGHGLTPLSDRNQPVNQGPGKTSDTDGDGRIPGADVLAPASSGGWADGTSEDGDSAHRDDLLGWNFVAGTDSPADDNNHGS